MRYKQYNLLPFQFKRIDGEDRVLLTNDYGEFCVIKNNDFSLLVEGLLTQNHKVYNLLKLKCFICDEYSESVLERLATKFRTKKKFIFDSTALHMLIMTHRCNQQCEYCHASSKQNLNDTSEDMTTQTAYRCIDTAFESPSPSIKIEFQGGEPTLNFSTIEKTVKYTNLCNKIKNKALDFVICTNLYELNDSQIKFISEHNIHISTSIDGPELLHNQYRKTGSGKNTFKNVVNNISKLRKYNSNINISALLTVTKGNLYHLHDVVNTYISLGFTSIFIRRLNPFGKAQNNWSELAYSDDKFIEAYFDILSYIIQLNKAGTLFTEEWAAILLTKILTPHNSGFVDIQSPAGAGISALIYDVDGKAFISDEARMYYRTTKDQRFCLGNVNNQNRQELMSAPILREVIAKSIIETLPGCSWCAYQSYCGSDPVRNFSQFGDLISLKSIDPLCYINKKVFEYLFKMLSSTDDTTLDVFWAWATGRTLADIGYYSLGDK